MVVADIILRENNAHFDFPNVNVLTDDIKGVRMHKIDMVQSQKQSALFYKYVGSRPQAFCLACVDIEAIYDPNCVNGNYGPGESNPTRDPGGFDVGWCQLKLKYVAAARGITVEQAETLALDPEAAIQYFFGAMDIHLVQADAIIANPPTGFNAAYSNRYLLATCLYNFGLDGMTKPYIARDPNDETKTIPMPPRITQADVVSHGKHVINLERKIAQELGTASVFPVEETTVGVDSTQVTLTGGDMENDQRSGKSA